MDLGCSSLAVRPIVFRAEAHLLCGVFGQRGNLISLLDQRATHHQSDQRDNKHAYVRGEEPQHTPGVIHGKSERQTQYRGQRSTKMMSSKVIEDLWR